MSDDAIYWHHTDDRGLVAAFASASSRASVEAWAPGAAPAADYRAALASWVLRASDLADGLTSAALGGVPTVTARAFPVTGERARYAGALLRSVALLSGGQRATASISTSGGAAPNLVDLGDGGDAGDLGIVSGAAVFLGGVVGGALGPYLVAAVLGITPEPDTRPAKLVALTDELARVLAAHRERERVAGKKLPFTAAERATLDRLTAEQSALAHDLQRDDLAPSATKPLGFLDDLAKPVVEGIGAGFKWGLIVLTVGALVWAYTETHSL